METTETKQNETSGIISAIAEMTNPDLDSVNPHFKSRFTSLACVLKHVKPVLKKYGVAVMQDVTTTENNVSVKTMFISIAGGGQIAFGPVSIQHDGNPQKLGSIVTYLRRYSLLAACGICGDEDDDGNYAKTPATSKPEGNNHAPKKFVPTPNPVPQKTESRDVCDWKSAVIHFGKHKGKTLGELDNQTIHWYESTWSPKKATDEKFKPKAEDIDLMNALKAWNTFVEMTKENQQDDLPM